MLNSLTPEESHIILDKGTEPPNSGEYNHHTETGTFLCRQCGTPLFSSEMKFDSLCGWPAFDDALPGRVQWTTDSDGRRTEITCANCGGHLGHVFIGEKLTEKNTRHCVNSLSMRFIPEAVSAPALKKIYLGGGCFWCIEAPLREIE